MHFGLSSMACIVRLQQTYPACDTVGGGRVERKLRVFLGWTHKGPLAQKKKKCLTTTYVSSMTYNKKFVHILYNLIFGILLLYRGFFHY